MIPRLRRIAAPRACLAAWLVAACVLTSGVPAAAAVDIADAVAPTQVIGFSRASGSTVWEYEAGVAC